MKYFALIYLSLIGFFTYGQKYETIRYFNQNNGLNSEIIYNIEEDTNNFFWISTDNGVLKYNGNSFKKFSIKNGLPSNDIFKIKVDSKNRVWLTGYYYGLYYIQENKIVKVKNSDEYNTLEFLYEHKDTIFFKNLYQKNITYVTKNSNVLKSLPLNLSRTRLMVIKEHNLEVYRDFNTMSFFITYKKKRINVPKGYVFYPNLSSSYLTFCKDDKITDFHSLHRVINNDIIYFKDGKWHKLLNNVSSEKVKILNRDLDNKYTFLSVSKNNIIVLNNNQQDYNLSKLYSSLPIDLDKIYFTFIDNSGNIWVITNANQLIFIPKNYRQISSYDEKSIFGNTPSTIKYGLYYKEKFFLITNDNLFGFFDVKDKKYSIIDTCNNNEIPYKVLVKDNFLILCTNNSILYYDSKSFKLLKKIKTKSNKNSKIIDNQLFYSKGGSLNTNDSTILLIKNTIRFKDFLKINNTYYCSNENHIISKSVKENLYKTRTLKYINVIERYNDHIIVGTNSNGLLLLNQNLETVSKVENSKNICDIKIEKDIVYVLTTNSLYVYQIIKNEFILQRVKTNKDGILDSRNKNINTDNSNIYIFSQSGISIIDKKNLSNKSNAKIDFECFEFSTNEDKVVRLKRENNTLNFLFNVNSFEDEGNFKKLIRFESGNSNNSKWEEIHNKNFTYRDLNPGYHTLILKLTSENLTKDEIKEIKFYIEPYFWETKLFYFVIIIVFVSILVFLFLFYKRRVAKKYQLINKMNTLELKALKSQMNPHFVFNTLNGLQSIIFTKSEIEINNYFVKFSRLLRITLEILNKDKVTLNDEINYLRSYIELEQVRKINDFIFTIDVAKNIDLNSIEIPVMLLQPLVENAIEHGINKISKQGKLMINVKEIGKTIIVEIEDNGVGIDLEKIRNKKNLNNQNSFACNIIIDRIKVLNVFSKHKYKIEWFNLNDANKTGTRVVLTIIA